MKAVVKSSVETVCLVNGRLEESELLNQTLAPYLNE